MIRRDLTAPQPAPVARAGAPSMHDVAAALHLDRRDHGLGKYGSLLQTHNGRSAEVDRLQETLDHVVYEIQAVVEAHAVDVAIRRIRLRLETGARGASSRKQREALVAALEIVDEELDSDNLARIADRFAAELAADRRPSAAAEAQPADQQEVTIAHGRETVRCWRCETAIELHPFLGEWLPVAPTKPDECFGGRHHEPPRSAAALMAADDVVAAVRKAALECVAGEGEPWAALVALDEVLLQEAQRADLREVTIAHRPENPPC